LTLAAALGLGCAACHNSAGPGAAGNATERGAKKETTMNEAADSGNAESTTGTEIATFGAGCFWCVEAVLEQYDGVLDVTSGYMGGDVAFPTYEQVCRGTTGHAEVVQVTFDPAKISYEKLLDLFWKLHDPTTLNRQGNDVGTQYRSVIFYHSDAQRVAAEASKKAADASGVFSDPIVTEIVEAGPYYKAEDYHQDYYRQNPQQPYCRAIIAPKLEKLGLDR
jgi:peptide-methionine (S)-S-oxide reductase